MSHCKNTDCADEQGCGCPCDPCIDALLNGCEFDTGGGRLCGDTNLALCGDSKRMCFVHLPIWLAAGGAQRLRYGASGELVEVGT